MLNHLHVSCTSPASISDASVLLAPAIGLKWSGKTANLDGGRMAPPANNQAGAGLDA